MSGFRADNEAGREQLIELGAGLSRREGRGEDIT